MYVCISKYIHKEIILTLIYVKYVELLFTAYLYLSKKNLLKSLLVLCGSINFFLICLKFIYHTLFINDLLTTNYQIYLILLKKLVFLSVYI